MNSDFTQDYFALFALPQRFALDLALLERNWRAIAAEVHPDRFASAPDAERRRALMVATRVNEAYQTLKKPISRARYLLSLAGVDTQEETNTSMPADFLMLQMEWHEALADAKADSDIEALEKLSREIQSDMRELETALTQGIDHEHDLEGAAVLVRKLRFLEKIEQDTGDAIEALLY
ncbi:Fe-S protein assembly co-chaperone HscB [Craterilacuibacter sinensis]|uniref:Co-chaperone protein HscB homolog n=1 Tax=Craterilacuibacter sinensis TaxID=2686017 RepID=A0A845BMT1_9NEIS|nr:Fe-S protein assembly co-chaperone HscB [Craterilacuibacter sinensis]MXR35626.1 Fe-S protein assembly co-chaperone HscB [Craterilacuibacter sinensis]